MVNALGLQEFSQWFQPPHGPKNLHYHLASYAFEVSAFEPHQSRQGLFVSIERGLIGKRTPLHLAHQVHILRRIMEQVPVDIEGHCAGRVPKDDLDFLKRPPAR